MNQKFRGWKAVANCLIEYARLVEQQAGAKGEAATRLNPGQRASLYAIAERITRNGVIIADEVGMGKTRIAVEVARAVVKCGGRVAILIPPGLGYQWQTELRAGAVVSPPILRSSLAFLAAWHGDRPEQQDPWFASATVMLSHAFANWRLGENAASWRWAFLPEVYARWRARTCNRLPRGYHRNTDLSDQWVRNAAESIVTAIPDNSEHQAHRALDKLLEEVQWSQTLRPDGYSNNGEMRIWLERIIGLGLGVFDLAIIDEAHKGRRTESGLSRLVNNVVALSENARRLALTATPVELDVVQWHGTLSRIGLTERTLAGINDSIVRYADAVKRVRQSWRSSEDARENYKVAAEQFQRALTPYLLRRDKRGDRDVQNFSEYAGCPVNDYRQERQICVEPSDLTPAWRQAVCAAEALSIVVRVRQAEDPENQAEDRVAQRLRLTLANGHGIAALLDQIKRDDEKDREQEDDGEIRPDTPSTAPFVEGGEDKKRRERAQWWLDVIGRAFSQNSASLFNHPAIGAAVEAIEEATGAGEKVLVFGRFTLPLRALVDLLNAREMLRRLHANRPWPQAKVHGEKNGDPVDSEWPAVRAAFDQLQASIGLRSLDEQGLDRKLAARYERDQRQRTRRRGELVALIEKDLGALNPGHRINAIFAAFKRAVENPANGQRDDRHPLALVDRGIMELGGEPSAEPSSLNYGMAFCGLIDAASDRDDADHDDELDNGSADELWKTLEVRLNEEYNRPQGGFARLMYGGTSQESRRMIQLSFNRANSFPRVLVAQSIVAREGLNLHEACRIVVMLHPEWNPGVVEQQIGRVDRVGSRWCKALGAAIDSGAPRDQVPRIELRPVIFRGTYDEHNWGVLRGRWDDLRAQLHGEIVPQRMAGDDKEAHELIVKIARAAPNFSPSEFGPSRTRRR
jgi:superfamily II DNA or RNA helicase